MKLFPPIIGFRKLRKLSGREFQTDGPAIRKGTELMAWYDQRLSGEGSEMLP